MNSDYVIRIIGICVVVLLIIGWICSRFITIIGINGETGLSIAKDIVANHEDPSRCNTIHLIDFFPTPPEEVHKADCFYTVAEMTKDPTVCRYLMPSEYGRSCIGAALDAADLDKCNLMGDKSVRWLDNGNLKEVTLQSCEKEKQTTVMARNCCYISRLTFSDAINDCSGIQDNPQLLDECYYQLANKKHETAQCASIQNSKMRSACELLLGNSQK